jgi:Rieske Fe-S protein
MKLRYILGFSLFFLFGCANANIPNSYVVPTQKEVAPIEQKIESKNVEANKAPIFKATVQEQVKEVNIPAEKANIDVPLSNDNTYINSQGNEVHSPAFAPSQPAGASALCGDGTYSFSQSRRGTCSHHGGVVEWY